MRIRSLRIPVIFSLLGIWFIFGKGQKNRTQLERSPFFRHVAVASTQCVDARKGRRVRPRSPKKHDRGMKILSLASYTNPKSQHMAKYSKGAGAKVKEAMHERKEGTLKSGR